MHRSKLKTFALLSCVCTALTGLQAAPASAHPAAFTIEQIMGAPYPSSLTAAPAGGAVAWVFDTQGVRNVWAAAPRDGVKARPITDFSKDDGYDIDGLAWSSDAKAVAFTRGGSLEDDLPANIISSPEGPTPKAVWIAFTSGGAPRRIGAGQDPQFSPDGARLVFSQGQKILITSGDGAAAPGPLLVDQGRIRSMLWSPDGRKLAFVSNRGSHALVGVYDLAKKDIVWLSPSLDHDGQPVFSPDGSKIAFIRVPEERGAEFISHRAGEPWSIWLADASTGVGRRMWVADPGPGSVFHPTLSAQNLLWTAHDQLVFPWEKTGWLQLYALPLAGGGARALTSGEFEVSYMAAGGDRRRVVLSSGQSDINRMHVWTVDVDGGRATRVADEPDIEANPALTADGGVFALRSSATESLQPVVWTQKRWEKLAPESVPATFPSSKLIAPQAITFIAKDGQEAKAQIFVPNDGAATHPAILFFHGGPRRQMLLGFHHMDAYNWMYSENEYFASKGYIVLSVNYRGGIGYGLNYREADNFGPDGGSELNDLLGAVSYLQSRKDVNAKKIGIWGASYGGLMTALGLSRASGSIAAGVDYAGLYNWDTFLAGVGAPIEGAAAKSRAVASSPIATIDQWRSPVLIVQADDDRNVPSHQATELIEDLRSRGVDHDEIMIPNEIHDLLRHHSWLTLFNAADAYFDRKLMN
jgi:dipeptidyl aminopeptidase/acylaminoacyl peptidase